MTARDPWIDLTGIEVMERILAANPRIASVELFRPWFVPPLQERLELTGEERQAVERALDLRSRLGVSFWDAMMITRLTEERVVPRLWNEAKFHATPAEHVSLSRSEFSNRKLQSLIGELTPNEMLAISSRVTMENGQAMHVPMIDFQCKISPSNLVAACDVIRHVAVTPGVILTSSKSYHFYGERLITPGELIRFLATALFYAPIVDRAWIAHQIIEGECALRISPDRTSRKIPVVVARVET